MKKKYLSLSILLLTLCVMIVFTSCGIQTEQETVTEKTIEVITSAPLPPVTYVLNKHSKKIHKPDCGTGDLIAPKNRATYTGTIDELIEKGYTTCGNCFR